MRLAARSNFDLKWSLHWLFPEGVKLIDEMVLPKLALARSYFKRSYWVLFNIKTV